MKKWVLSLALAIMIVAADACSSTRESRVTRREARTEHGMGQRDKNNRDVVVKSKTEKDDNGVTVTKKKTVRDDNGKTVKVKKHRKDRKNNDNDSDDNEVIIDTNR